jgi:hypothetical protein
MDGPNDTHTLRTHKMALGKLGSAAGDGYFESQDHGNSWKKLDNGLGNHTHLTSIAINTNDPLNKIMSAHLNTTFLITGTNQILELFLLLLQVAVC